MTVQRQRTEQGPPATDLCRTPLLHLLDNRGRKNCFGSFFSMDSVGVVQDCKQIHGLGKKHHSGFSLILLQIFPIQRGRFNSSLTNVDLFLIQVRPPNGRKLTGSDESFLPLSNGSISVGQDLDAVPDRRLTRHGQDEPEWRTATRVERPGLAEPITGRELRWTPALPRDLLCRPKGRQILQPCASAGEARCC